MAGLSPLQRSDGLTPRQRVQVALSHHVPPRVPMTWGFGPQPPARRALDARLAPFGLDVDRLRHATDDQLRCRADYVGPPLADRTSVWGWTTSPTSYGPGSYDEFDHQPLAHAQSPADLAAHPWPDPDHFDVDGPVAALRDADPGHERFWIAWGGNALETLTWMMGLETVLMHLALQPELIVAGLERVVRFYEIVLGRLLDAGRGEIDAVFIADDLGGQTGPLFSPGTYRQVLQPFHRRQCQVARAHGVAHVLYHTDGSAAAMLDDLIDAGVTCLEAVQIECEGMAPHRLKQRWGDRLSFQGGVSVQQVLPHASAEVVRQHVEELVTVLGEGGGYVCSPSHAIQAGTPPENVFAMLEAVFGQPTDRLLEQVAGQGPGPGRSGRASGQRA